MSTISYDIDKQRMKVDVSCRLQISFKLDADLQEALRKSTFGNLFTELTRMTAQV